MKQCPLPGLLFTTCCRMPGIQALLSGIMHYPLAFSSKPESRTQGPLPSLEVCTQREMDFGKPPVWFFSLPKGPRDENGDLPNR